MPLTVCPRSIGRILFGTIAALTALHLLAITARLGFGHPQVHGFVPLFDTNQEHNVPAFFSALNMLLCAFLLALIAAADRRARQPSWRGWRFLAVLFVLLPFDELFGVHERLNGPLHAALDTAGPLAFAWVLPYGLLTLAVGALGLRLLADVPRATRLGLILSGCVFVSGAIGLEMLGGWVADRQGMQSIAYAMSTTVEELLEMSGIALFTYVLLMHMSASGLSVSVVRRQTRRCAAAADAPMTPWHEPGDWSG